MSINIIFISFFNECIMYYFNAIFPTMRLLGLFVFVVLLLLIAVLSVFALRLNIIPDLAESSLLNIMCLYFKKRQRLSGSR